MIYNKKTVPKHRFSCLLELHGDQAEAQDEQKCNHGDSNVVLLVLAGEQGDQRGGGADQGIYGGSPS